jgi:hypothetical protein
MKNRATRPPEGMLAVGIPTAEEQVEHEEQAPAIVMTGTVMMAIGIEDVLTALLPVINEIHGGCDVCRNHFLERANAVLEAQGVPYRFSRPYDRMGQLIERKTPVANSTMADLVLVRV